MSRKLKGRIESEVHFASGMSFYKLALFFIFGSVFGTWYEEIITLFKFGHFESRRGVIIGPFNPLYGVAFLLAISIFSKFKSPIKIFILGSLIGGVFEYTLGLAQEIFIGSRSWSYEGQFLNLHGRTSLVYAMIWGLFAVVIVKIIYPFISNLIEQIPRKPGKIISDIVIVFLIINMSITFSMLIRYNLRTKGFEPLTPIGEFYDKVFTDEVIQDIFPDMIPLEPDQE